MKVLVLLYNDRDRPKVAPVHAQLVRLIGNTVTAWMASADMTAFGDIFEQIETQISDAAGVIVFLGAYGLGRFQQNIEMGAVKTEIWQRGAEYGRLLVHLTGGLEVPRSLLQWPTVNHDGALTDPTELALAITTRFGLTGRR